MVVSEPGAGHGIGALAGHFGLCLGSQDWGVGNKTDLATMVEVEVGLHHRCNVTFTKAKPVLELYGSGCVGRQP